MRARLFAGFILTLAIGFMPFLASTQTNQPAPQTDGQDGTRVEIDNPLGTESIPELIGRIVNAMLGVVGSLAFLMFVWGGFNWLISGGSSERVEKGKKAMVYASIGLVIVFSSYALVRFVLGAFTSL